MEIWEIWESLKKHTGYFGYPKKEGKMLTNAKVLSFRSDFLKASEFNSVLDDYFWLPRAVFSAKESIEMDLINDEFLHQRRREWIERNEARLTAFHETLEFIEDELDLILIYKLMDGCSVREIAKDMGVSSTTIHRRRKQIVRSLTKVVNNS